MDKSDFGSAFLTEFTGATDGFSMASMKEFYVATANEAFQDGCGDITTEHARKALELMRRQYGALPGGRKVGFGK